jgi:hypothetical protein
VTDIPILLTSPYFRDENSLYNISRLLNRLDIPELEDKDWDVFNFQQDFLSTLNNYLGFNDIVIDENGYVTIGSLKDEQSAPAYIVMDYEEVNWFFKNNCQMLVMMMFVFLKNHGFLNDIARGYVDQIIDYSDMEVESYLERDYDSEIGEDDPVDPREVARMKKFSASWLLAQNRMEHLYSFLNTDIDMFQICDLMESYEPFNENLLKLCSALRSLQKFVINFNCTVRPITSEETICDLIVWYGNDQQYEYDRENINEAFGNDGLVVKYLKGDGPGTVNEELIDIWNESKWEKIPTETIDTYDDLIKIIYYEQSTAAFAGLCDKSDFLADLYGKLDRMPGRDKGNSGKWETVGVCANFTELLKAAHRHHIGK